MPIKGIILAAGRGSRMGSLTDTLPKCRIVLHGKELIQWQLEALHKAGIRDISLVRGYLADTFNFDLTYFENPRWEETNMVVSLSMASDWLNTDVCVVSYSDIVYSEDAVRRLMEAEGDLVITYDPNWRMLWEKRFEDPLADAESFRLSQGRVVEIGNQVNSVEEVEGQYMGLIKFTPSGWHFVSSFISRHSKEEQDAMDMTKLLQGIIAAGFTVKATPIADTWCEVDSENDLRIYEANSVYNLPIG